MTTRLTRPATWTLLALGGSVLALNMGRSRRERAMRHSPEAMEADLLSEFTSEVVYLASDHGNRYTLAEDAPLPMWFHEALAGAVMFEAEGPWPNWGSTFHPVDWPALIDAHPDVLVPCHEMLELNDGASWPAIAEAFAIARRHDPLASLSVHFWVGPDGRTEIEPVLLRTSHDLPDTEAMAIDRVLVAGGRRANLIHGDSGLRCEWEVNC